MPRGSTSKIFTQQELKKFEEISFKNMVTFYREELVKVSQGKVIKKILTSGDIRALKKCGILQLTSSGHNGRILEITPRAHVYLKVSKPKRN